MKREEAIEVVRKNLPHLGIGATKMTEALEILIPELRGSEDENALRYLHELISFGYTEKFFDAQTAADMRDWVNKSLRPQPHWKPSEKQMDWLGTALRLSENKPHIHAVIESLYNELNQLKDGTR